MEQLLPFLVCGAFLAYFAWRGRREGMTGRQWVDAQNRELSSRHGWAYAATRWARRTSRR